LHKDTQNFLNANKNKKSLANTINHPSRNLALHVARVFSLPQR